MSQSADLAAIRAAFGRPVTFNGGGVTDKPIIAVRSADEGGALLGSNSSRTRTYEVAFDDVPEKPVKGDALIDDGVTWAVIKSVGRDEIEAWVLGVERAA